VIFQPDFSIFQLLTAGHHSGGLNGVRYHPSKHPLLSFRTSPCSQPFTYREYMAWSLGFITQFWESKKPIIWCLLWWVSMYTISTIWIRVKIGYCARKKMLVTIKNDHHNPPYICDVFGPQKLMPFVQGGARSYNKLAYKTRSYPLKLYIYTYCIYIHIYTSIYIHIINL